MSEAILGGVQLQGADLGGAELQGANLWGAQLQGANLYQAHLQGADLWGAKLQGADLQEARLQGANLQEAQLQGANLQEACLQGAILQEAQLQGVELQQAQLQGVRRPLEGTVAESQRGLFVERMISRVGVDTELDRVTFEGGLTEKDMEEIRDGSPSETAEELTDKLRVHVGKPLSHQLPADSGAVTGAYTSEEVQQWIAEYPERLNPNHVSGVRRRIADGRD